MVIRVYQNRIRTVFLASSESFFSYMIMLGDPQVLPLSRGIEGVLSEGVYFHFLIVQTTTPQTSKLSSASILMGLKLRLAGLNSI